MTRRSLLPAEGMEESFAPRPRSTPPADPDITPMTDVTFLLLIFFMVTSTMQPSADVKVPRARNGEGIEKQSAIILTVRRPESAGELPVIVLGEGQEATALLSGIPQYVREGIEQGRHRVVIRADREVPHGFVQQVMRAAGEAEDVQFHIGIEDSR